MGMGIISTKSMIGHLVTASSAVELIITCLALRDNIIPPTINLEVLDSECDLDYVPKNAKKRCPGYSSELICVRRSKYNVAGRKI